MSPLIKEPFQRENETKQDIFTIKLSKDGTDRERLDWVKLQLRQPKDSTAIKQALEICEKVLLDEKTRAINRIVFKNKEKNWRTGTDPEYQ